ncbi:hypothetical protein AAG906_016688 [Vitis piasezkii]
MVRVFTLFLLALLAISMLHTIVLASHGHGDHHYDQRNYGPGKCKKTQHRKPCTFFVRSATKIRRLGYNNWKAKEGGPKCPWLLPYLPFSPILSWPI